VRENCKKAIVLTTTTSILPRLHGKTWVEDWKIFLEQSFIACPACHCWWQPVHLDCKINNIKYRNMNKIQKQNNASETDSKEQLPPSQQGMYTCVWRQLDAPTALDPVQCTVYMMKNKQKPTLQELTLSTAPKLRQWAAQPPYMDTGLELSRETVNESCHCWPHYVFM